MEYILAADSEEGCIFCKLPQEDDDRRSLIVFRGQHCFVVMNKYPYNNGHLMVVPYRHTAVPAELSDEENLEMIQVVWNCLTALRKGIAAQGFNIGMNLGRIAGAGVEDHLHFHIVPRWAGDTNFMPVIGHTKVLSEGLWETWEKLKEQF